MAIAERLFSRVAPSTAESHSTHAEIFRIGNGIDLAYPYPDGSRPRTYRYEDKCFRDVATRPIFGKFYIGPYAVDKYFSSSEILPLSVRPDILGFTRKEGKLELTELFEVRTKSLDLSRKLNGFQDFLRHIKNDGHLLGLFDLLGVAQVPSVPHPTDVAITFITPRDLEEKQYEDPRFARVSFRKIS